MNRKESIKNLQTEAFDLCIIGGGASGAGCALDAALRGLKVLLIEKDDFAAGTSSKSTKLIHGGVRYLEQAFKNLDPGQLRQVRHGLQERHSLLANAPHLTRPLALVTPVFSWLEGLYYRIGLWLYDRFAPAGDQLPSSRWLSKAEARQLLPGLTQGLHSAVLYYDGQLDDARYCLALVQSAAEAGAQVINHAEVLRFEKNKQGQIVKVRVRDCLGQNAAEPWSIQARCFLNCTGPQADSIRQFANPIAPARIRPSKGVHLVLPLRVLGSSDTALLIPKTPDGRVVFAIPFQGRLLLGTTDQDYPNAEQEPGLEAHEVDFLLNTLAPYLAEKADRREVQAGFGGLRPLLAPGKARAGKTTKGLIRDHEVESDPESGLFSLLGGKWTTYRLMASDAIDAICQHLGVQRVCTTQNHCLAGAENFSPLVEITLCEHFGLPKDIASHLAGNYGCRATQLAELVAQQPGLGARLASGFPFIQAEVLYTVRMEMACTLRDVLARRIRLEVLSWSASLEAIPVVANLMASELGWTSSEKEREQEHYTRRILQAQYSAGY